MYHFIHYFIAITYTSIRVVYASSTVINKKSIRSEATARIPVRYLDAREDAPRRARRATRRDATRLARASRTARALYLARRRRPRARALTSPPDDANRRFKSRPRLRTMRGRRATTRRARGTRRRRARDERFRRRDAVRGEPRVHAAVRRDATRRRDDDATRPNARAIEDELLILKF